MAEEKENWIGGRDQNSEYSRGGAGSGVAELRCPRTTDRPVAQLVKSAKVPSGLVDSRQGSRIKRKHPITD